MFADLLRNTMNAWPTLNGHPLVLNSVRNCDAHEFDKGSAVRHLNKMSNTFRELSNQSIKLRISPHILAIKARMRSPDAIASGPANLLDGGGRKTVRIDLECCTSNVLHVLGRCKEVRSSLLGLFQARHSRKRCIHHSRYTDLLPCALNPRNKDRIDSSCRQLRNFVRPNLHFTLRFAAN